MVTADCTMNPSIQFSQSTGGIGGGLGAFSPALGLAGAVAGSLKTNEASTTLILIDKRPGVQLAAAERRLGCLWRLNRGFQGSGGVDHGETGCCQTRRQAGSQEAAAQTRCPGDTLMRKAGP